MVISQVFGGLEAHQRLRLFPPVYYWLKIKSNDLRKTGVLYLHENVHEAGQTTEKN
jgi:hypothetical protein